MKCAQCPDKDCSLQGKDCTGLKDEIKSKYSPEDLAIMKVTNEQNKKYYMEKTRIEEIIGFAKEMKFHTLGLAFCISMSKEAEILNKILSKEFKVFSTACKICGLEKEGFITEPGWEGKYKISCNPLGQAEVFNNKNTQLNIVLGLCLGHDMLFAKYSKAPSTTLAVKDRVLAHNPLGALYSVFYRKLKFDLDE